MRYILSIIIVMGLSVGARGQAANVYVTPDGSSQTNCTLTPRYSAVQFNNSANWGIGATQIGPSTIVHLCGTFTGATNTTLLTAQGSGTSGHTITIFFETGANLTSVAFGSGGAINIAGRSYIVVDGGVLCGQVNGATTAVVPCNGTIQNTGNGSSLGHIVGASKGVSMGGCTPGCRVTNMNIINMYVHVAGAADTGFVDQTGTNAVFFLNTAGVRIDHNVFHDCGWCMNGWGSNLEVDHNSIYNMDHGTADGAAGNVTGNLLHDNHFGSMVNWDTPSGDFHHDGIHQWNADPFTNTGARLYNNLFDGDCGVVLTSQGIYIENMAQNYVIFNNVFIMTPGRGSTGMIWPGNYFDKNFTIVNNTFVGQAASATNLLDNTNTVFENNQFTNWNTFVGAQSGTTFTTIDYNAYEHQNPAGGNFAWNQNGFSTNTFSAWQAHVGQEANSRFSGTSTTNANGTLQTGSPSINAGANLTSLGIVALNSDINGVARPATGNWTIGAYNAGGSVIVKPNPPTNVVATPN